MNWISTKDRLPQNEERVLICTYKGDIYIAYRDLVEFKDNEYEWVSLKTLGYSITYKDEIVWAWMPLPDVPQDLLI